MLLLDHKAIKLTREEADKQMWGATWLLAAATLGVTTIVALAQLSSPKPNPEKSKPAIKTTLKFKGPQNQLTYQ